MQPWILRVLATVAVACAGGAQVAAGMTGNHHWQVVFLLFTALTAGAGAWLTMTDAAKKPQLSHVLMGRDQLKKTRRV